MGDRLTDALALAIARAEGVALDAPRVTVLDGGLVERKLCVDMCGRRYFAKCSPDAAARFAAEADGLAALARCPALVVPRVVARGQAGEVDYLVMTWLELAGHGDDARLGEAVAALHDLGMDRFGWPRDNFIGATPQRNARSADWADFFLTQRLAPQLAFAAAHGAPRLETTAAFLFATDSPLRAHRPRPVLLHGDLWRGNVGFVGGAPALFDPAVHAGDAECDLAMAALFGGFGSGFFSAYHARHPAAAGWRWRRTLYQLYHVLNHYNLFGGGYASRAEAMIDALRRDA